MTISGPFFPLRDAAEYCGYAPDTFARFLREYDLPRIGPAKNRFARSVLDAWMASPDTFRKSPAPRHRKPRPVEVP